MKTKTLITNLFKKSVILLALLFLSFTFGSKVSAQVLQDASSSANGGTTWSITTTQSNELILISIGGYGNSPLNTSAGTVTVDGNDATYISEGEYSGGFYFVSSIWAYVATTPGTYNLACTESGLESPYYFNYSVSVYQPSNVLSLSNIILGGNNSNSFSTSITASITTTMANTYVYGDVEFNDNAGSGTINWNGSLTEQFSNHFGDGVDGSDAGATIASPGTLNVDVTCIGADNPYASLDLIGVQPSAPLCTYTATISTTSPTCGGYSNGSASVNISGGSYPPYTYSWSNSATTSSVSGLSAGNYTVVVTDNGGCAETLTTTLTQPSPISFSGSQTFNFTSSSEQSWVVPSGVTTVSITTTGGSGGNANAGSFTNLSTKGGYGATINGTVSVTPGDNIMVIVGGSGYTEYYGYGGSGGGGTFVWDATSNTLLQVAGGGGGAAKLGTYGTFASHENGGNGQSNTANLNTPTTDPENFSAAGGTGGNGGSAMVGDYWAAGGGAGWLSNGATGTSVYGGTTTGGEDPANGGAGGSGGDLYIAPGAYGGGGGGNIGGGGGGGYNGGGGGGDYYGGSGGGGGSYCSGTVTSTSATNIGNGIAMISYSSSLLANSGCYNMNNASITTPTPNGGSAPYTYSWAPGGQTTQNISGLSSGSFTLTITDANGCVFTSSATVVPATPLTDSIASQSSGSCGGQGYATVGVSGGTPAYTYSWSSGQTTAMASGLSAGSYSVTVTDANGCTTSTSVTLIGYPGISATGVIANNDSCNGLSDGSAYVNVTGTTSPYTYAWSTGATTSSIGGLSAGTYTVLVTDTDGCTATASVTITQPFPLSIFTLTSQTFNFTSSSEQSWTVPASVTSITVTTTAGSGGNANAGSFTNLSTIGGYGATINGVVNVNPGDNVMILVGGAGYTEYYGYGGSGGGGTYVWDATSNTLLQVAGGGGGAAKLGTYGTFASHENGGDGQSNTAILNNPTTDPYNYSAAGGTGGNGGNVMVGDYWAASGGAGWFSNGATATSTYGGTTVGGEDPANGGAGGSGGAEYIAPGGYGGGGGGNIGGGGGGGYNGGGAGGDYYGGSGGGGGSYCSGTVTSTSATNVGNGVASIMYAIPGSLVVTQEVSCFGGSNGILTANVNGGTRPYTYAWSPNGGNDSDGTGLSAGTYTVLVTDANGCTTTSSATITQPTLLTLSLVSQSALSCGSFGYATFAAAGGTPQYTYSWSPGGYTTATVTTLSGGSYTVTVTDSNSCTATSSVTIMGSPGISATGVIINNDSCNSESNGNAYVSVTGVTSPYTYLWSNGATTDSIFNLSAGDYTVTVTDTNGCTTTAVVDITQPAPLTVFQLTSQTFNFTSSFEQSWTVPAGVTAITVTTTGGSGGDAAGADANLNTVGGFGATVNGVVNVNPGDNIMILVGGSGYTQVGGYGGSGGGGTYVWDATTSTLLEVAGGGGGAAKLGTYGNFANHENGGNGQANTAILNDPTMDPYNFSAAGGSGGNGGSTMTATSSDEWAAGGGAGWFSNGGTANSIDGGTTTGGYDPANGGAGGSGGDYYIAPGGYGGGGGGNIGGGGGGGYNGGGGGGDYYGGSGGGGGSYCSGTVNGAGAANVGNGSAVISYPIPGTLVITQEVSCFGGSNGILTADVFGGTRPYTYVWSPAGGSDSAASGLSAGSYTVVITDANGCTTTASATLTQPTLLTISLVSQSALSCGSFGYATFAASGGTPQYTYSWSPGGYTGATVTTLSGGSYTVTVTDSNSCTATSSVTIASSPGVSAATTITENDSCYSEAIGSGYVTVTGSTSPYTYLWSNGATTSSISNLSGGTYTITVTDTNGCTATATLVISSPLPLQFGATVNFAYTSSVEQSWTVPAGVTQITVTTTAGSGGYASSLPGGSAATINGVVTVTPGHTVMVLVGGEGLSNLYGYDGGGGGGTYVWDATSNTVLQVAGGGGGAGYYYENDAGGPGQTNTAILNNPTTDADGQCSAGGSGGNGGTVNTGTCEDGDYYIASGGAGWASNGFSSSSCDGGDVVGGADPANGGAGGGGGYYFYAASGGYGGGGGGEVSGGGGGGYNGGGAGFYEDGWGGGGGGSYCAGTVISTSSGYGNGVASIMYSTPNIVIVSNVSCFGGDNGTLSAAATGGTPPYTYSWSPVVSGDSVLSGLSAGSYTVTVTDANGCTLSASATITQPTQLVDSITSVTNGPCFGTGSATVGASGGISPYTYLWSNGQTTATATGLTSGSYTVTVTDSNSCTATTTVTISQPAAITGFTTAITEDSCNGDNTGSASATISGGTTPYTYLWSNGATTDSISGLTAGTYTLTVTDANGCVFTTTVTITQPAPIEFLASMNFAYTSSFEQSWTVPAGVTSIVVTTTGAQGGNANAGSFTNLSTIGGYGATVTGTVAVTPGDNIMVLVGGQGYTNYGGYGGGGGGGTYVWDATSNTLLQVGGGGGGAAKLGTYGNFANHENGGDGQGNIAILNDPTMDPYNFSAAGGSGGNGGNSMSSTTSTDWACGGGAGWYSNGATGYGLTGTTTGGADPTNGGAGGSGGDFYIAPGGYGGGGGSAVGGGGGGGYNGGGGGGDYYGGSGGGGGSYCSGTVMSASATNTGNGLASISYSVEPQVTQEVSCFGGANGVITAFTPVGGTSPYFYNWSPSGGTNLIASGLSAGSYTLTVTDSHGCMDTVSATITQPTALVVNTTVLTTTPCDSDLGSAFATVSGGTGAYTYNWSNGETTDTATGLTAGTYTVTVTDANSCTMTAIVTINCGSVITTASVITNVSCFNGNNGSAVANPSGGTTPYTYLWSNGETTDTATGLSAGSYTVTVTDANNTIATASVTISQPTQLTATGNDLGDVSCWNGNNGSASVTAGGGTSPYTYAWSNSATTSSISALTAGTYTVLVTDNNGCTATASVTISQPTQLTATGNDLGDVSCWNGNNGSASVTAGGGTSPYTYAWSNTATTSSISALTAGTYTVLVTDNNGCTATASVTISQPTQLTATGNDLANNICFGGNIGSASVTAGGGTSPYTYAWSNSATTSSISALTTGTYTVLVTDNNGCTATASVTITSPTAVSVSTTQTDVTCLNAANGTATANASGGTSPYTYDWSNSATTITATGLSAGSYTITVTDNNGCSGTAMVTITQPATGMTDSIINVHDVGCNGGNGGYASIGIRGGTPPYTYAWSNGNTTNQATGLSAGTYTVTVMSNNDCSSVLTVTITQPAPITDSLVSITNPTCHTATGSATVGVSGGTVPYTYTWTRGVSTTNSATGLIAGSYTVTIKDNHGCTSILTFNITQPIAIRDSIVQAASHSITCKGDDDGYITVGVLGGNTPYTYTWTPNVGSTALVSNLSAGTYSVSITDINGCTGSIAKYTITQPLYYLTDSASVIVNIGCYGGSGGEISIGSRGGTSPYTYSWSNGNTRYTETGLSAGTYTIAITDNHGCSQTEVVSVTQPAAPLQATVASSVGPGCYGGKGTASVSVTGGTPNYSYVWVPNVSTTSSATLSAGNYTVTVKDAHGCNTTVLVTVTQPAEIRDSTVTALKRNVDCRGASDGSATAGVKYGTPPYTYLWSPSGQTNVTATGLSAGVYTLTVTDANGCSGTAATTTITSPAAKLTDSLAKEVCVDNLVTATVGVSGGTSPYTYLWSPGGYTKQQVSGLSQGSYTITVTDAHGCVKAFGKTLICGAIPPPDEKGDEANPDVTCCGGQNNINLYPNPNTGQFTLAGVDKGMIIELYDYTGRKLSTIVANENPMPINIAGQPNGVYLIRILSQDGNLVDQKKVVKTQ